MRYRPLTQFAHERLTRILRPGDLAVDATVGNGHDTLHLADQVGSGGRVIGFDIQADAIQSTSRRLQQAGLSERVVLRHSGHQHLSSIVTDVEGSRRPTAITFNLGYLPGGDKGVTTLPETTCAGIEQALEMLSSGGTLSILAYRGHPGGQTETAAVESLLQRMNPTRYQLTKETAPDNPNKSPVLFLVTRLSV